MRAGRQIYMRAVWQEARCEKGQEGRREESMRTGGQEGKRAGRQGGGEQEGRLGAG